MAFVTAALLILMLAGCSMTYTKPGLTQEEFNRDRYACQRDADAASSSFDSTARTTSTQRSFPPARDRTKSGKSSGLSRAIASATERI